MTTQWAKLFSRFRWSAIALAMASAGCASVSSRSGPDEAFVGVLEIFEYSFFRTASGEIYSIRVEDDEAQKLIADPIRNSDKSEPFCLRLAFSGQLLAEEDFVGRKIIAVKKLDDMEVVDCR